MNFWVKKVNFCTSVYSRESQVKSTLLHFSQIAITWNVADTNSFRIGYAIHSRPSMYPTVRNNVDVATIANPLLTIGN